MYGMLAKDAAKYVFYICPLGTANHSDAVLVNLRQRARLWRSSIKGDEYTRPRRGFISAVEEDGVQAMFGLHPLQLCCRGKGK